MGPIVEEADLLLTHRTKLPTPTAVANSDGQPRLHRTQRSEGHTDASGGKGTRAVLEVRSHDVPFMLEHGQTVGRLVYERLTDTPDKLYGADMGSNYQQQALALSKQFKRSR